jgi:hypothetical protein
LYDLIVENNIVGEIVCKNELVSETTFLNCFTSLRKSKSKTQLHISVLILELI